MKNLPARRGIPVKHGSSLIKMTTHEASLAGRTQTSILNVLKAPRMSPTSASTRKTPATWRTHTPGSTSPAQDVHSVICPNNLGPKPGPSTVVPGPETPAFATARPPWPTDSPFGLNLVAFKAPSQTELKGAAASGSIRHLTRPEATPPPPSPAQALPASPSEFDLSGLRTSRSKTKK